MNRVRRIDQRITLAAKFLVMLMLAIALLRQPALGLAAPSHDLASAIGDGRTGVQIQNLSGNLASFSADVYDSAGSGLRHTETLSGIAPGAAAAFYFPALEQKAGVRDAVIVLGADQPSAVVVRTDWADGRAGLGTSQDIGPRLLCPFAAKSFMGATTRVLLGNPFGEARSATLRFHNPASPSESAAVKVDIEANKSTLVDLHDQPAFAALPAGTKGWIEIEGDDQSNLAAASLDSRLEPLPAETLSSCRTPENAELVQLIPLFRSRYAGSTSIALLNPGSADARITVTYVGSSLAPGCRDQRFQQGVTVPIVVEAGSSLVLDQSATPSDPRETDLPDGCFGSAWIESVGSPILSTVIDQGALDPASGLPRTLASFEGQRLREASTRVAIPLVRQRHTAQRLVTGIQVMNVSGLEAADAELRFIDRDGNTVAGGPDRKVVVPPLGSATWYVPSLAGMDQLDDWYGSALIDSSQPLVGVIVEFSLLGEGDVGAYLAEGYRGSADH